MGPEACQSSVGAPNGTPSVGSAVDEGTRDRQVDVQTSQQRSHVEYYNARYADSARDVDFDHFSNSRFGPWSPYWYVYDYVSKSRNDSDQRLLSYGCGTGRDALIYAKMGYEIHGFDISDVAIQTANKSAERHELDSRCHFSVQTAESLNYPDGYFDIIVGVDVLHHIDVEQAVPEIHRVLKKDGVAVFREPLATPLRDLVRNSPFVTWLVPKGTKSLRKRLKYTIKEGEHKLAKSDFQIIRRHFGNLTIKRWRVLALLGVLFDNRPFLERCDWTLFKVLPFLRYLGDQAVLIAEKQPVKRRRALSPKRDVADVFSISHG